MNRQFLLFQALCAFLIASSAYGAQLPGSITSQYSYCYELRYFKNKPVIPSIPDPSIVDNLCMDWQGLTYHFLSSAQGGTTPLILAPKAGMTVVHYKSDSIGFKFDWLSEPTVNLYCRFHDPKHALHVYYDIYQLRPLTPQDVTISRAKELTFDRTGSQMVYRLVFTSRASLYTEYYSGMQMIMTLREESANGDIGDPLLIFMAPSYKFSDLRVNNSVVLRSIGESVSYVILTFDDASQAENFCNSFDSQFDASEATPIPREVLHEILANETHL